MLFHHTNRSHTVNNTWAKQDISALRQLSLITWSEGYCWCSHSEVAAHAQRQMFAHTHVKPVVGAVSELETLLLGALTHPHVPTDIYLLGLLWSVWVPSSVITAQRTSNSTLVDCFKWSQITVISVILYYGTRSDLVIFDKLYNLQHIL